MSLPPRNYDHRAPKRPRFPPPVPVPEEEEEEEDEDYSAASLDDEDDDNEEDYSDESADEEDVDVEVADDVGDTVTEAQSRRSVSSSSPSSSSLQLSVRLKSSEVLDCPTCLEPLEAPIYQCNNGHITCSVCLVKVKKQCPSCRIPIGDIRCRALEKVVESSIAPCRYTIYGCKETFLYGDESKHEKVCVYVRCLCPLPNCSYSGAYKSLQSHARVSHSWDTENLIPFVFDTPQVFSMDLAKKKTAVFQERKEGDLVVVQAFKGTHGGVCVTVSSIAPMPSGLRELSCSIAKLNAFTTLKLGLRVKKIQNVREQEEPKDDFLFIPDYMLSGDDPLKMKMQICIGKGHKCLQI